MTMVEAMAGLSNPEHLSDGLYVAHDDIGGVWLKAERYGMIHEVYMEAGAFRLLAHYIERVQRPAPIPVEPDVDYSDPGYADANDND